MPLPGFEYSYNKILITRAATTTSRRHRSCACKLSKICRAEKKAQAHYFIQKYTYSPPKASHACKLDLKECVAQIVLINRIALCALARDIDTEKLESSSKNSPPNKLSNVHQIALTSISRWACLLYLIVRRFVWWVCTSLPNPLNYSTFINKSILTPSVKLRLYTRFECCAY